MDCFFVRGTSYGWKMSPTCWQTTFDQCFFTSWRINMSPVFFWFPIQVGFASSAHWRSGVCSKSFVVRWATVTGRMCGVPAHAQAACACCLRVSQLSVEVVRERIFMYACRQRCVGQVLRVRSLMCMYASPPNMDPFLFRVWM